MHDAPVEAEEPDTDDKNVDADAGVIEERVDELGLPCDVKQFLQVNCQKCHGAEAKNGTPLLSRDNLMVEAKKDPTVPVVQRMLMRMSATDKPMPPMGKGDPVSEANLEMFTGWVDNGMPAGHCDEDFAPPAAPAMPATPAVPATPAAP